MVGVLLSGAIAACDPQEPDTAGDAQSPEEATSDATEEATEEETKPPLEDDDDGDAESGEQVTLAPEFLECGSPEDLNENEGLMLADLDLAAATWAMPDGFVETPYYSEENPVEDVVSEWVVEPASSPLDLNVVNVILYDDLDWGDAVDRCGRVPIEAVEERLARYREQIDATPIDDAEMMLIDGHPAITQRIQLENYSYVGYWLFSIDQLLHLYCQWTPNSWQQGQIEAGCDQLIESVSVD